MKPRIGRLSFAVAVAIAASTAVAQQRERIEVTGSNIKRIEGETALPVTVITRDDIDKMGATSPEAILKRITARAATYSDTPQGVRYAGCNANPRVIGS